MEAAANRELSRAWDTTGSVREDPDCRPSVRPRDGQRGEEAGELVR